MIVIVDYGMGNLGSVFNMIKKIGFDCKISSDKEVITSASKLILPGVGAFDNAMEKLKTLGFIEILNQKVLIEKTPILGICLGMQIMTNSSEEGVLPGLGWFDAVTKKFSFHDSENLKIPHMGWNFITPKKSHPLFSDLKSDSKFYFVHSYYVSCKATSDSISTTKYGSDFTSAIAKNNIMATQFHPEKSHKYGFRLLNRFLEL